MCTTFSRIRRLPAGATALLTLLAFVLSCARNPVTGRRELVLMSEEQEIAMGGEADPQIVAMYGLYEDPELNAYVDRVGKKLAALSHRPNLPWTFRVLDSPVVNAFALPGGYIYVTRGILAYMNDEAQLALVLGHEIGHVTARHSVQQYSRSQLAGLGLGVGTIILPDLAQYGQLAQTAVGLLFLKYGRDDERQSDELGVEYASKGGYDPRAGARFFEVLERMQEDSGQMLPGWLSTHPDPGQRVDRTLSLGEEAVQEYPQAVRVAENEHKQKLEGTVFGDDPRHGFVEDGWFKHPDLAFRLRFPQGWKVQNTASAVYAGEPQNQAVMQMTLAPGQGQDPRTFGRAAAQRAGARLLEEQSERIHGYDAYLAVLALPTEEGGEMPVLAAFIQRETEGPIFQILGYAAEGLFDRYRAGFLESMRSLQALTDPGDLAVQPNRIGIERLDATLTLGQAVARAGDLPVAPDAIARLNNRETASPLQAGFLLKLVRGSYRGSS